MVNDDPTRPARDLTTSMGGLQDPPPEPDTTPPNNSLFSHSVLDIQYAGQSEAQKLDLFLPSKGQKPYPVIVRIHGGGFHRGDKQGEFAMIANPVLSRGYAIISMNYRFSNEAIFPAQIFDAKAAVRWVRANSVKYDLDPGKLVAAGDSAGGYLAVMLGTSANVTELEDLSMGNAGHSSAVNSVISWFAPIDFLQLDAQHKNLGQEGRHDLADSPESMLIGGQVSKNPEKCKKANPLSYLDRNAPPFYIQHGMDDDAVPYLQSVQLAKSLKIVIGRDKVRLELIENIGHMHPDHFAPEHLDKIFDFLAGLLF